MDIAKTKFQKVLDSEGFKSLTKNELSALPSYQRLTKLLPPRTYVLPKCLCATLLVAFVAFATPIVIFTLVHNGYFTEVPMLQNAHREASRYLIENVFDLDFESEYCLIEMVESLEDLSRPAIDCSICQNVTKVETIAGISLVDFEDKFAYSSKPVVITDAMVGWTAQEKFTFEYFKTIYRNDSPVLDGTNSECQFFPYQSGFMSLRDVFEMSLETTNVNQKPWYIGWSNCDSTAANTLRQHYRRPYFLPTESESSRIDWIFMGMPGYGAPMHIDNVGFSSWQAQVKGTKRWILEPPPECYLECNVLEVVIQPGEIFVFDSNRWFHETYIEGDEMSITIGSEYD